MAALVVAVLVATTAPASAGADRPTGYEQIVVQVSTGGGFVPQGIALAEIPELTIYGDGRVVFLGPTTLEYPGPALPNQRELRLSSQGVDRVVRLARAAGLLERRTPRYGSPDVTDLPSTTVTVNAGGEARSVWVYALGYEEGELSARAAQNRRRLQHFLDAARTFPRRFVVEREQAYDPTAVEVHRLPAGDVDVAPQHTWPLPTFGVQPAGASQTASSCTTLTGADAATALAAAGQARSGAMWNVAGQAARLVFRPLLPGEGGCTDTDVLVHVVNQPNGWGGENARFDAAAITVYRDGRIVVVPPPSGAPGPAPTEVHVSAEELARIEQAARDAGLAGPALDYGEPGITDQGNTIVEVVADGELHRTVVYALGMENVDDRHLGLTDPQLRAREQLKLFIDLVTEAGRPS